MSVNKIQYMHAVYIHVSLLRNSCTENTVRNQWENRWFNHYNECLKWVTYFINICSLFTVQTGTGTWSEKGKGIHWSSRVQRQADCWCRQVCWEGSSGTTSGNQWAVSVHAKKMFFLDMQRLVQTSVLLKKKKRDKTYCEKLVNYKDWIGFYLKWSRFETWLGSVVRCWAGNWLDSSSASPHPGRIISSDGKLLGHLLGQPDNPSLTWGHAVLLSMKTVERTLLVSDVSSWLSALKFKYLFNHFLRTELFL